MYKELDVSTSYTINAIKGSFLETSIPGNIISDSEIDAVFFVRVLYMHNYSSVDVWTTLN